MGRLANYREIQMTAMKTDTEDVIRVTITFRRESYPEWYDRLIDVKSGRARADIVRAHLALPRGVSTSTRTLRQEEKPGVIVSPEALATDPKPVTMTRKLATPIDQEAQPEPAIQQSTGLADILLGRFGPGGEFP